jgi:cytochrome b
MSGSSATMVDGRESARPARTVAAWDPLVRSVHWIVAALVLLNGAVLDEEGSAHELVGYAALSLVGLRLLWGVVGARTARFSSFPPDPGAALSHLLSLTERPRTVHLSHNPLGALMVYNLWATLLALCVTGIMMTSVAFFGMDWVEEIHELLFDWLMISVGLHVAGVLLESRRTGSSLVRAMIDGRRRVPAGLDVE